MFAFATIKSENDKLELSEQCSVDIKTTNKLVPFNIFV